MKELTCIVCPIGCSLVADESSVSADSSAALTVTGNRCPRGVVYAQEELRFPKRVVTATCACGGEDSPAPLRIPVKTTVPCPKDKIPELLGDIYKTRITLPVHTGDVIIADWKDSGIDVVATRSLV